MKQICAWCGAGLNAEAAEPDNDRPVSHGICHACAGKLLTAKPVELTAFLDRFPFPVLLITADNAIEAANSSACAALGRSREEFRGKRPGDVAECIYAEEAGGCGRDVHCTGCALRKTLLDTFATGRNHRDVPASAILLPRHIPQPVQFRISTEMVGDFVMLKMEKAGGNPPGTADAAGGKTGAPTL